MATYKETKGVTIQTRDEDPTVNAGSWSSGGNLNQERYSLSGAGTQTAGLVFGGYDSPSRRTLTEKYDGSSWTEVNDMSGARNEGSGAGTQTSAMMAGGRLAPAVTNNVELFYGTNWT